MRANLRCAVATALAFFSVGAVAMNASAQNAQAQGQVGMTLSGAAPPAAAAVAGDSDHDMMVGTLAIGYLGRRGMLVGAGQNGADQNTPPVASIEVQAPVLGVRYWIDEMLGIDAGIGFNSTSRDGSANGVDAAVPGSFAFVLHGGVPFSLADAGHFSFQIIPELNVGFGSSSLSQPGADGSGKGFHLDIGARGGAEIHFGFIGIPQLSLQGSIGLAFAHDSVSWENAAANEDVDASVNSIATSVQDNPWNIFTSNVAALYYF